MEEDYLKLVRKVVSYGTIKGQRATLADGRPLKCYSLFGESLKFSCFRFPIITTKKMYWRIVLHELAWYLRGESNIKYLKDNGVNIWNEWADANGDLGASYPTQWRGWEGPQGRVDQISKLLSGIKSARDDERAAESRRLLLMSYNPSDLPYPNVPPGCHTMAQFNVCNLKLNCVVYMRSADLFLGVPYNIAVYSLLLSILAKLTGLAPNSMMFCFGDVHLYENHISQAREMVSRIPNTPPFLRVKSSLTEDRFLAGDIKDSDFELSEYVSYGPLPGDVAI